jgi:hypothetical protein
MIKMQGFEDDPTSSGGTYSKVRRVTDAQTNSARRNRKLLMGEIDTIMEVEEGEDGEGGYLDNPEEDYNSDGEIDYAYRALRQNERVLKTASNTDLLL